MIRIQINQQPLPKQRPRVVNGRAYTPTRTRDYEEYVGMMALSTMRGHDMLRGDLSVALEFRRMGKVRADLDNLTKAVLDGLQGIVFQDDAQIVRLMARVEYGCKEPGTLVTIQAVEA